MDTGTSSHEDGSESDVNDVDDGNDSISDRDEHVQHDTRGDTPSKSRSMFVALAGHDELSDEEMRHKEKWNASVIRSKSDDKDYRVYEAHLSPSQRRSRVREFMALISANAQNTSSCSSSSDTADDENSDFEDSTSEEDNFSKPYSRRRRLRSLVAFQDDHPEIVFLDTKLKHISVVDEVELLGHASAGGDAVNSATSVDTAEESD